MRKSIYFFLLIILSNKVIAQNELQLCAEKKNNALRKMLNGKKMSDADMKKYGELNKEWNQCIVGKKLPEFAVTSMTGEKIDSKNLQGKILVINFWFISCPPSIAEMPALNQLVSEYSDSAVIFLGITYQKKSDLADKFFPKYKFDFKIIPEAESIEELFGVLEHPVTFIVDKKGFVKVAWTGGATNESAKTEAYLKAKPIIDELLKAQ
jgi:thiol-disulfide isomerase/thioredoxin